VPTRRSSDLVKAVACGINKERHIALPFIRPDDLKIIGLVNIRFEHSQNSLNLALLLIGIHGALLYAKSPKLNCPSSQPRSNSGGTMVSSVNAACGSVSQGRTWSWDRISGIRSWTSCTELFGTVVKIT